ncbi:MAG: hypothetical protein ACRDOG_02535 [Gaiellaceae bacterium]
MTGQRALGSVGRGLLAGMAGTAAMTLAQEAVSWARNRRSSIAGSLREPRTWADAPPPAQVARRAANVVGYRVTKRQVPVLGNAVHLGYGIALGGLYGLAQERLRLHPLTHGAIFGTAVWGLQYAALPALEIYEPIWRYPPGTLAVDLSYHLAYGLGVAGAHAALDTG